MIRILGTLSAALLVASLLTSPVTASDSGFTPGNPGGPIASSPHNPPTEPPCPQCGGGDDDGDTPVSYEDPPEPVVDYPGDGHLARTWTGCVKPVKGITPYVCH